MNLQIQNRDELPLLLGKLNLNGLAVEIGVQMGLYSEIILSNSKLNLLCSIDCWQKVRDYIDIANKSWIKQRYYYRQTIKRLRKFGSRSRIIKEFSEKASDNFKENSLDFVYIDANHSYEGCKKDIEIWWPKLKTGGIFAGHDYLDGILPEGEFGVKKAVDEFIKKYNQDIYLTKEDWPTWYLIKK